jgi:heat shock protein HtpX
MEMCVDNPRNEFADVFDTHPSVDKRVEALIKFAGGHDPGPLALKAPEAGGEPPPGGPWGEPAGPSSEQMAPPVPPAGSPTGQPFLPDRPPVELGGSPAPDPGAPGKTGPWGRH